MVTLSSFGREKDRSADSSGVTPDPSGATQWRLSLLLRGPGFFAAFTQQHVKRLAGFGFQHAGDQPQRSAAFAATLVDRIGRLFHGGTKRVTARSGNLIIG